MAAAGLLDLVAMAAVLGAVAGLFYWSPKIFGRRASHAAGFGAATILGAGALLVGLTALVAGFLGQPDRPSANFSSTGAEVAAILGAVGVIGLLAGLGIVMISVLRGAAELARGASTVPDPWGGHNPGVGRRLAPAGGQLRRPAGGAGALGPSALGCARSGRRRHPGRCSVSEATAVSTEGVAPAILPRRRTLQVGAGFASAAVLMYFGGLLGVYFSERADFLRANPGQSWIPAGARVELTAPTVMAWTLLLSVVTMQWAVHATARDDRRHTLMALLVTAMFGVAVINQTAFQYGQMGLAVDGGSLAAPLI